MTHLFQFLSEVFQIITAVGIDIGVFINSVVFELDLEKYLLLFVAFIKQARSKIKLKTAAASLVIEEYSDLVVYSIV